MNKWVIVAVKIKKCYAIGGGYVPDSITGGLVAGSLLTSQYAIIPILIVLRTSIGVAAIFFKIVQKESELDITWINPYLDQKLTSRRGAHGSTKHKRH